MTTFDLSLALLSIGLALPALAGAAGEASQAGQTPIDCPLHAKGVHTGDLKPFAETEKYIEFLERSDRAAWQKPDAVIQALGLRGTETVADVGAGSGYFTFRLATALPRGKVVATDIDPEMIRHIHHKVLTEGVPNVGVVMADAADPTVPGNADLVFISDVLHHVANRPAWLGALARETRPGARLAVIEFREGPLPQGPPEAVKIPKADLVSQIQRAGFVLETDDPALLPYQTFLVFRRAAAAHHVSREGLVEYVGAQRSFFTTGKAEAVMSLKSLEGRSHLFAIGPVDGLDGEITIFDSKPSVSTVRGAGYAVDDTFQHGAAFLVWAEAARWQDILVPEAVKGYADLQRFVRAQAAAAGIDVSRPFPFLLSGTPREIKWHINVDRTEGQPITQELFSRSKAPFVTRDEPVDIVGFYSEKHAGVFLTATAPGLKDHPDMTNAIHLHQVSRASKASGHVDDLTLAERTILRLPRP